MFQDLWSTLAPSKVVAFGWRVLINRLATKDNLALRNVLPVEEALSCVSCGSNEESSLHLFLHCDLASAVWLDLMRWLGEVYLIPLNLFIHWECWKAAGINKMVRKGRGLIWLATIWVLWKARNDKIFNGVNYVAVDIVETVKVLSWRWILSRTKTPACLYYEWC